MFLIKVLETMFSLWVLAIFVTLFLGDNAFFFAVNVLGVLSAILLACFDCFGYYSTETEKDPDVKLIQVL